MIKLKLRLDYSGKGPFYSTPANLKFFTCLFSQLLEYQPIGLLDKKLVTKQHGRQSILLP